MTLLKIILYFLFIFFIFGITIGLIDIFILKPLDVIPGELNFLYVAVSFIIGVVFTWKKIRQGGFQNGKNDFSFK